MPSMYRATVPVMIRGLKILTTLLDKGEAHAAATGQDPAALLAASLAPDMLTLTGQIQRVSDTAKAAIGRLTDITPPPMPDDEVTFADLKARLAKTIAFLDSVDEDAFDGSKKREVTLKAGAFEAKMSGEDCLLGFVLPNFYFHLVTAYAILRHQGVAVGKLDYLGPMG
ncbi:MAG: DUF1993 domain-containing protein [bacterium]|nr:DUF1993 domain-containing protein [bacterium]